MIISTLYLPETTVNVQHQHIYCREVPELVRRGVPS